MGFEITKGKVREPLAMLIYGGEGIGKSELASEFPGALFIGPETNKEKDVARFPKPEGWTNLLAQLEYLCNTTERDSEYETLVLDSADTCEGLLKDMIKEENPGRTLATAYTGHGAGYVKLEEEFRKVVKLLMHLRDKKDKHIVIIAHANKENTEDLEYSINYQNYDIKLYKKVRALLFEWVETVLFLNNGIAFTEDEKPVSDGKRYMFTERRHFRAAKNKFGLPEKIEYVKGKGYLTLKTHIDKYYASDKKQVEALKKEVLALKNQALEKDVLKKEQVSVVDDYLKSGDVEKLKATKERLNKLVNL